MFALSSLILLAPALLVYFGSYGLRRVSFLRKQLLKRCVIIYCVIYEKIVIIDKMSRKLQYPAGRQHSRMYSCFKWFIFAILFCIIVLSTMIFNFLSIFFKALILWRAYATVVFNFPLLPSLTQFVSHISSIIGSDFFAGLFYPFLVALDFLVNLNITLSSSRASCSGIKAPLRLLLNCLIAGLVIVVVESDVAVFWMTSFASANLKFSSLSLNKHIPWEICFNVFYYSLMAIFFGLLLPNPIKMIQYLLGNHVLIIASGILHLLI